MGRMPGSVRGSRIDAGGELFAAAADREGPERRLGLKWGCHKLSRATAGRTHRGVARAPMGRVRGDSPAGGRVASLPWRKALRGGIGHGSPPCFVAFVIHSVGHTLRPHGATHRDEQCVAPPPTENAWVCPSVLCTAPSELRVAPVRTGYARALSGRSGQQPTFGTGKTSSSFL